MPLTTSLPPFKGGHKMQFSRVEPSFPKLLKSASKIAKAPASFTISVFVRRGFTKNLVVTIFKKSYANKNITRTNFKIIKLYNRI